MAVLVGVCCGDVVACIVVPSVVFDWVLRQVRAFVSRGADVSYTQFIYTVFLESLKMNNICLERSKQYFIVCYRGM